MIPLLWEQHRVYLHKPRHYSLLHTQLGYMVLILWDHHHTCSLSTKISMACMTLYNRLCLEPKEKNLINTHTHTHTHALFASINGNFLEKWSLVVLNLCDYLYNKMPTFYANLLLTDQIECQEEALRKKKIVYKHVISRGSSS